MKRLIIFAAMLATTVAAMAQPEEGNFTIQPKFGINVATLSDADKSIVDITFGLEAEYMFSDWFGLSVGAVLSNQGAKYNETATVPKYEVDLDYVQVPVLANFYVLPGLAIKAGVQPGFKMRAKYKNENGTVDLDRLYGLYNHVMDENLKVSSFDISIPVGISYEFKNIVLDARYNWGLNKVLNQGDAFYNRWFMVTLGYKFKIGL